MSTPHIYLSEIAIDPWISPHISMFAIANFLSITPLHHFLALSNIFHVNDAFLFMVADQKFAFLQYLLDMH